MHESDRVPSALTDDEQRLLRLFRCLDNNARSETLRRLGKRLMMEAAVDPRLHCYENPEQEARRELRDGIDERLTRLWPHCVLLELRDFDYDVTKEGWQEAGISIAEVILGSGQDDEQFADMLVDAYLEGAETYDVPLPSDFAEPEESKEAAVQGMREDLQREALTFIKGWRERVLLAFEQGP